MVRFYSTPNAVSRAVKLVVILVSCWLNASSRYEVYAAAAAKSPSKPVRSFGHTQYHQEGKTGLRADLIHPDDVNFPGSNSEITDFARTRNDVVQTAGREEFLNQKLWKSLPPTRLGRKPLEMASRGHSDGLPDLFGNNPIRLPVGGVANSLAAGYQSMVSVTGGGYSMTISIGTPPRKFTAFADTGSDLPWVQCTPCERCFLQDEHFFDPAMSSSYRPISCSSIVCDELQHEQNFAGCSPRCSSEGCNPTCRYEYEYGDQTHSSGDMATETLTLSDATSSSSGAAGFLTVPGFVFGCGHDNSGSINQTGASGVIGLGRGELSFLRQLRPYMSAKFSTCFVDRGAALAKTSPILFGEMAATVATLPRMQYTPIVSGNSSVRAFYYINVEGISVGNRRVVVADGDHTSAGFSIDPSTGQGGTILDSGSTLTSLVPDLYSPVMEEFLAQAVEFPRVDFSSHGLDLCFVVTSQKTAQLPSLTLHLTGANWTMPHENIAFGLRDGHGGLFICVALTKSKYGTNIIGNFQQQNFQILYDLENERIGFAKTQCDKV